MNAPIHHVDCKSVPVEISRLERADGPAVQTFAETLSEHDLLFLARDIRRPKVTSAWLDSIDDGTITSLIARANSEVCGITALVRDLRGWSPHVADIRMVIGDKLRGKGLGRVLLEESLKIGVETGATKFIARMTPDQRSSLALFEAAGFRGEALLRDHVHDHLGDPHDLVIMSLHVEEYRRLQTAYGHEG
jgi:RimJ/RimL family protein N-acetyltransferase